jgi:hypothetical protein
MATQDPITPAQAAELFSYDPDTGALRWRVRAARCVQVGDLAGARKQDGYIQVTYQKRCYQAHRIAWAITHGEWPNVVDHINGDRADNRLANLREVTVHENMQNQRRAHRSNKSAGILGVHFYSRTGRWRATNWANGRNRFLGYYATADEASAVYLKAKRELHPGNTL